MTTRVRGRRRDPGVDQRILAAAGAILDTQGYARLSMEAVARAAGVGKQTLYRRWPRKPLLVFEAVFGAGEAVVAALPDRGSLAADLEAVTAIQAGVYRTPGMRELVRGLLADCLVEPALRQELSSRFLRPRLAALATIVESARERGEVDAQVDSIMVAETVAGSMLFHFLLYTDDADGPGDAFGTQLADVISKGVR